MADTPFNFGNEPESHGDDSKAAVFVSTREPVSISVSRMEDSRAPQSSALAAYIGGRLVARCAMPPEAIDRLVELELFNSPVPIGLFAYEDSPGLQCRLFALVPRDSVSQEEHADEPWKASVPSYEASEESEEQKAMAPFETILLGHIVRFQKDRQHPDDLAAEAVDILQKIISSEDALRDADKRAIDDLLDSL